MENTQNNFAELLIMREKIDSKIRELEGKEESAPENFLGMQSTRYPVPGMEIPGLDNFMSMDMSLFGDQ